MDIVYIFRDEKRRDDSMVGKEARIFNQVMLTIFVHFIYIVFDFVMGKLWLFCQKVSIRVVLIFRVIHLGCGQGGRKRRRGRKIFGDLAGACSGSLASTISRSLSFHI